MKDEKTRLKDAIKEHPGSSEVLASVAKSTTFAVVSAPSIIFKSVIKWFFHSPIKLFRPYAVSPWHILDDMAKYEGKPAGLSYLRTLYTTDGIKVVSNNFWPLIVLNSISGILLFTAYRVSYNLLNPPQRLSTYNSYNNHHSMVSFCAPFASGAVSGVAVSILITPVHNIRGLATPNDLVANRHAGILKYSSFLIKRLLLSENPPFAKIKLLFNRLVLTSAREALCYSLFFGTFDNLCNLSKKINNSKTHCIVDKKSVISNTPSRTEQIMSKVTGELIPILAAGASAGVVYNLASWPFRTYRGVILAGKGISNTDSRSEISLRDVYNVIRKRGISVFYSGVCPQLIRVVTPSAIGLFVYRMATEDN